MMICARRLEEGQGEGGTEGVLSVLSVLKVLKVNVPVLCVL